MTRDMTSQDTAHEAAILAELSAIASRMSRTATGQPTHLVFLAMLALVQVAIEMADAPADYAGLTEQLQETAVRLMAVENHAPGRGRLRGGALR